MWIKKINEYYDTSSEYDNNGLSLHMAVNLINMFKDRISFSIDEECNVGIKVIKYGDMDDDYEIDDEGLLYWLQFTFHKELIDIILSLKQKFYGIQDTIKKLNNDIRLTMDEDKKTELNVSIEKNSKELEALSMIMNKVDNYRRMVFSFLRDKESVEKMIDHIRIYKEQSD
tara:strand:- start:2010 stop:2522 length:513 start_codon:yes stop_codon:yes gene_type:complete